jgi:hypothetical protein
MTDKYIKISDLQYILAKYGVWLGKETEKEINRASKDIWVAENVNIKEKK